MATTQDLADKIIDQAIVIARMGREIDRLTAKLAEREMQISQLLGALQTPEDSAPPITVGVESPGEGISP